MSTEPKIHAVSEAFSMQPMLFTVGNGVPMIRGEYPKIHRIVRESVFDTGNPYEFYVGYDEHGNRLFQIRIQCATVIFETPKP